VTHAHVSVGGQLYCNRATSSNNTKVQKALGNKLQVLAKTIIIVKYKAVHTRYWHHRVAMDQEVDCWVNYYPFYYLTNKDEIHEEKLRAYN